MPRHPVTLHAARSPGGEHPALAAVALAVAFLATGCTAGLSVVRDRQGLPRRRSSASPTSASSAATRTIARPGSACKAGKCEAIPGYCRSKADCPANQECIANKCKACASDKECPGGQHCVKGTCTAKKACKTDNDCPQDEDCVNGFCSKEKAPAPPPAQCTLDAVFFDFNESALTTEATAVLARDADCLKKVEPRRAADRPHRPARHAGVQPGAVREARAVGARPPRPAGRRRESAVGAAARGAGREGDR